MDRRGTGEGFFVSDSVFNAKSWLRHRDGDAAVSSTAKSATALRITANDNSETFSPSDLLVPDFNTEGLALKSLKPLPRLLSELKGNIRQDLANGPGFNKAIKEAIFTEFQTSVGLQQDECRDIDTPEKFWLALFDDKTPFRKYLDIFLESYTTKTALLYLFKLRFIAAICKSTGKPLDEKFILYPASFLGQVFKKGSSTELACESLHTNIFSWFRPAPIFVTNIEECLSGLTTSSLNDILNHVFENKNVSHSLSHRQFGHLLKLLLVDFPKWPEDAPVSADSDYLRKRILFSALFSSDLPNVLSVKFTGDEIPALALAHWKTVLADDEKIRTVIAPDFVAEGSDGGRFLRHLNELHFLTTLIETADKKGHDAVAFLCALTRPLNRPALNSHTMQMSLLDSDSSSRLHDGIVLNLGHLPKNNPHFHLIAKITEQESSLKEKGHIVVLSQKKLFVHSQSEKVQNLLKRFKLEIWFDLENLEGRGEIGPYIYLFTRRPQPLNATEDLSLFGRDKQSCLSFRISGELPCFNAFASINDELKNIIKTKRPTTPLYQSTPAEKITVEFYQDAILDGNLINANSSEKNGLTHPSFFKNLMQSSVTFDQFFKIESLQSDEKEKRRSLSSQLVGVSMPDEETCPLALIVDLRNPKQARLEIIPANAWKAKANDYGMALCHYFGLIPKRNDINVDVFREYFAGAIGLQTIQLSLSGGPVKLKKKLSSLLIPRFFTTPVPLPPHLESGFSFFRLSAESLAALHPNEIDERLSVAIPLVESFGPKFPFRMLELLSSFRHSLSKTVGDLVSGPSKKMNFANPLIKDALLKCVCRPLLPSNPDVFVKFLFEKKEDIYSRIDAMKIKTIEDNQVLILSGKSTDLVRFHAEIEILRFIEFILTPAIPLCLPLSSILQGTRLPSFEKVKEILDNFGTLKDTLERVQASTTNLVDQLFQTRLHEN